MSKNKKSSSTIPLAVSSTVPLPRGTSEAEGVSNQPPTPSISDHLITALCKMYQPTGEPANMELKSTIDIVEEMAAIADVDKWEIQVALQKLGFEIKSTDAGYYWVMYKV